MGSRVLRLALRRIKFSQGNLLEAGWDSREVEVLPAQAYQGTKNGHLLVKERPRQDSEEHQVASTLRQWIKVEEATKERRLSNA